jgi:hypothetical protein
MPWTIARSDAAALKRRHQASGQRVGLTVPLPRPPRRRHRWFPGLGRPAESVAGSGTTADRPPTLA